MPPASAFTYSRGLTTSIGYRLTGTTEATFDESKNKIALALGHHIEFGIRYRF